MKTTLFTRPAWAGIIVCAALLALLPVLNLSFPASHPLHVSSYMVALVGKFMCYAMAALALDLARATVAGSGALAMHQDQDPAALREAVTSPGGTTAAGLAQLMDPKTGLPPLMRRTIAAAAARGRELGA